MVKEVICQQSGVSCLRGCRAAMMVPRNKGYDFWSKRRWKVREVPNCQSNTKLLGCRAGRRAKKEIMIIGYLIAPGLQLTQAGPVLRNLRDQPGGGGGV